MRGRSEWGGGVKGLADRLHWEYGKEMRVSEHRRYALFTSLAVNVILVILLFVS